LAAEVQKKSRPLGFLELRFVLFDWLIDDAFITSKEIV